jgi:biofilm protein TabA
VILDTLANSARYADMHPGFARAFEFLASTDLAAIAPGRHDLDGDNLFVMVNENEGRGEDAARLEVHRRYIDIQYTILGDELIGWVPLVRCIAPDGAFDEAKDILFLDDRPSTYVAVPPGSFAIFFPHDAHAPLAGQGFLKKAVVKVAVDLHR